MTPSVSSAVTWGMLLAFLSAFRSIASASGDGPIGAKRGLLAVAPNFLIYALTIVWEENGGPTGIRFLTIPALLLSVAFFRRRSEKDLATLIGAEAGAMARAFRAKAERTAPWSEAPFDVEGTLAQADDRIWIAIPALPISTTFTPSQVHQKDEEFLLTTQGGSEYVLRSVRFEPYSVDGVRSA